MNGEDSCMGQLSVLRMGHENRILYRLFLTKCNQTVFSNTIKCSFSFILPIIL